MSTNRLFTEENQAVATAIAEVDSKQLPANDPMAIIAMAVQSGAEPGQLRELLELKREFDKDRAAEAFALALTQFQRKCRFVAKTRTAKIESRNGPGYKYNFAGFDDVMEVAGPVLDECELAVSFSTQAIEKGIRCTCRIRKGIHFEDHTLDVPVPQMNVNDTQRYGAALSYAKRYALCAALNIVVTDDVDDDASTCFDPVSDEQLYELDNLMVQVVEKHGEQARAKLLSWMQVERLADIPAVKFGKAKAAIAEKLNARN